VTYLFANKKNRKMFEADPEKYLPAYGGYCAYGVAIGKKFAIDPEVWKIENGKLYLNLDTGIQKKWAKDIPGYIKKADANWPEIKEKAPCIGSFCYKNHQLSKHEMTVPSAILCEIFSVNL
jgi:hypothetical protein